MGRLSKFVAGGGGRGADLRMIDFDDLNLKEYEIQTVEQEECLQLKILFLLGYTLKIVV